MRNFEKFYETRLKREERIKERIREKEKVEDGIRRSTRNHRGISVAICSWALIYKSLRLPFTKMVVLLPSSSLFWKGKEDLDGKRAGGRNYDRRPVASLTDDASLRSRLRAQKDGTTVMDSE